MRILTLAVRHLLDRVFPLEATARLVRDAPLDGLSAQSFALRVGGAAGRGPWRALLSLLSYRDPLTRAAILETKFHDSSKGCALLATALADALRVWEQASSGAMGNPVVIIPIPLSHRRLRERGYNQVERVVRAALPLSGYECAPHLLERVLNTPPQTGLGASERAKNLSCAFIAPYPLSPAITYLVLDDVVTTGSTLRAACAALRKRGAHSIYAIALARQARGATLVPTGDVAEWSKAPHC